MATAPSLPPATQEGVLPEGTYDASLSEISERFGRMQRSTQRYRLVEKLRAYLAELGKTGWEARVILDGSFIMECVDEPSDIDIVLVLPADWDLGAELRPFEYNLVSKKRAHKKYKIHVFAVRSGSNEEAQIMGFFEGMNPKWIKELGSPVRLKKGLVRVIP